MARLTRAIIKRLCAGWGRVHRGEEGSAVNRAILRGLEEAQDALDARGILLVPRLQAVSDLGGEDPALLKALQVLFRALPLRLSMGATLVVWSEDKAGGDIEVGWEAREPADAAAREAGAQEALAAGPLGDLLAVAVAGLEEICRARLAQRALDEPTEPTGSTAFDLPAGIRRRFTILLPSRANRLRAGSQGTRG